MLVVAKLYGRGRWLKDTRGYHSYEKLLNSQIIFSQVQMMGIGCFFFFCKASHGQICIFVKLLCTFCLSVYCILPESIHGLMDASVFEAIITAMRLFFDVYHTDVLSVIHWPPLPHSYIVLDIISLFMLDVELQFYLAITFLTLISNFKESSLWYMNWFIHLFDYFFFLPLDMGDSHIIIILNFLSADRF